MAKKYYDELNDATRERLMQRGIVPTQPATLADAAYTMANENAQQENAADFDWQKYFENSNTPKPATPSAGAQTTAGTPAVSPYVSKYGRQIDALYDAVINRKPFSYDYNSDPVYQQMREAAINNGQIAMEDTLGKVAARTGGLASSYAVSASQQAYNDYMAQLNGVVPELRSAALQMYNAEGDDMLNRLKLLENRENADYQRYLAQKSANAGSTATTSTKLSQFYNDTAAYIKELAVTDKQKAATELYAAIENGEITEQEGTRIARINGLMDEDAAEETKLERKNMNNDEIYGHVQDILRNSGINGSAISSPSSYVKTGASSADYAKYARGVLKRKNLTEYIDF